MAVQALAATSCLTRRTSGFYKGQKGGGRRVGGVEKNTLSAAKTNCHCLPSDQHDTLQNVTG